MDWQLHTVSDYLLFLNQTLFAIFILIIEYPARVKAYAKNLWLYLLFLTVGELFSKQPGSQKDIRR